MKERKKERKKERGRRRKRRREEEKEEEEGKTQLQYRILVTVTCSLFAGKVLTPFPGISSYLDPFITLAL